ncbi:MmyB family transcriptional regulator [Rhodococcoides navarretei]|uniref:MmyB-like transcription regulator ligand binding domain-containing protein n=1 Tax=Rhodococcus navarretei TaxID=3128981 RepID=A0ABU9CSP8_9NOCA
MRREHRACRCAGLHGVEYHFAGATKFIQHPAAGTLQFGIEFLTSPSEPDQSLIVYTVEEGSSTAKVLPILASWDPSSAITP